MQNVKKMKGLILHTEYNKNNIVNKITLKSKDLK